MKNKQGERLFPEYDRNKWKTAAEAADEALKIAEEGGKELVQGSTVWRHFYAEYHPQIFNSRASTMTMPIRKRCSVCVTRDSHRLYSIISAFLKKIRTITISFG